MKTTHPQDEGLYFALMEANELSGERLKEIKSLQEDIAESIALSAILDATLSMTLESINILQKHIDAGAYIKAQDGRYILFDVFGEGIATGDDMRDLLDNFRLFEQG